MSALATFLTGISTDSGKLEIFQADPEAAMTAAGLNDTEKALVRSGNKQTIKEYFEAHGMTFAESAFAIIKL